MESKLQNRNFTIDRFRGIVIFSMIIFQFMANFAGLGGGSTISHHAPDADAYYMLPNLAVADIVAPMFILAIGLTYLPSLRRRIERDGKKTAIIHFVKRNLMLIGIGIIMNGINDILDGHFEPFNLTVVVPTALVLVLSILWLILRAAKQKKISAPIGKILGILVTVLGVYGVGIALVNFVMMAAGKTNESYGYWLVLHHIGFAGLVALPFALINGKYENIIRIIAGFALLGVFGLFHSGDMSWDMFESNQALVDNVADGGFIGGFAWGAMLIIYLAFSDIYMKSRKNFFIAVGIYAIPTAAVIAGIFMTLPDGTSSWAGALSEFMPINKPSVSPAFVIITVFISLLAFLIVELFAFYKSSFDPFMWWGKNPILMYCLEFGLVGGITVAGESFFETASAPIAIVIVAAMALLLTGIAYICNKKKIIIKL